MAIAEDCSFSSIKRPMHTKMKPSMLFAKIIHIDPSGLVTSIAQIGKFQLLYYFYIFYIFYIASYGSNAVAPMPIKSENCHYSKTKYRLNISCLFTVNDIFENDSDRSTRSLTILVETSKSQFAKN